MKKLLMSVIIAATLTVCVASADTSPADTCNRCTTSHCKSELAECMTDGYKCMETVKCVSSCDSEGCVKGCLNNAPSASVTKALSLLLCTTNYCSSECK